MSPYLVHDFDGLTSDQKKHFRDQVILVLHAINLLDEGEDDDMEEAEDSANEDQGREYAIQKVLGKLYSAEEAFGVQDFVLAERKVRTARKLITGEPIRPRK